MGNNAGYNKLCELVFVVRFERYLQGWVMCRQGAWPAASRSLWGIVEDNRCAGTADRGLGNSISWYALDDEADFDRYSCSFRGGYYIRSVSDGRKLARWLLILSMCATNEYEEAILELVPAKSYPFAEPALVLHPLPEQVIACIAYQVAEEKVFQNFFFNKNVFQVLLSTITDSV